MLLPLPILVLAFSLVSSQKTPSSNGNTKFASDLLTRRNITASCRSTIQHLQTRHPPLRRCFPDQSLFYTDTDHVCSSSCLTATIRASRELVTGCRLPANHHYAAWSHTATAHAACIKYRGRWCLDRISYAISAISQLRDNGDGVESGEYLDAICDPCVMRMYHSSNGHSERVPKLYYSNVSMASLLFREVERHCLLLNVPGGQKRHLEDIDYNPKKKKTAPVAEEGDDDDEEEEEEEGDDDGESVVEESGLRASGLQRRGLNEFLVRHGVHIHRYHDPLLQHKREDDHDNEEEAYDGDSDEDAH